MDIQAILDDSDESSSDGAQLEEFKFPAETNISGHVDIEQILREEDDDDDADDDDDGDEALKVWENERPISSVRPQNINTNDNIVWNGNNYNNHHNALNRSSASASVRTSAKSDVKSTAKFYTSSCPASHSAEDWAVLQALLGEEEGDDDDDDDNDIDMVDGDGSSDEDWKKLRPPHVDIHHGSGSSAYRSPKQRQQHQLHQNGNSAVDSILLSDEDDDEDNIDFDNDYMSDILDIQDHFQPGNYHRQTLTPDATTAAEDRSESNNNTSWSSPAVTGTVIDPDHLDDNGAAYKQMDDHYAAEDNNDRGLQHQQQPYSCYSRSVSNNNHEKITLTKRQEFNEVDEEAMSSRALAHAQAYERKLLKSGHRDIVSPLQVKRRLKQKIELGTRMQKKHPNRFPERLISTPNLSHFNFSGVVENRTLRGISSDLKKEKLHQKSIKTDVGLPTAIAVNSKFIAVGTQRGIILVFDLFEVLRQVLTASNHDDWNLKDAGSITSVDLHMNDEILVAGYTSGVLILWDTIKGVMLRSVTDTHPSPITSVRFLSDLRIVTVDAGGLVNKLSFSKNVLWSTYSMETECLLDGTAGQILAMNVLKPISTVSPQLLPDSLPSFFRSLVLIALSSERSSFAVAVEPSVHVLHRWARPPMDRVEPPEYNQHHDQSYLPCLSWGWALVSGGGNRVSAILARAWGCCIQLLIANFPTLEDSDGKGSAVEQGPHWPAFGVHDEFDVPDPVVALEWLNDRSLLYLTVTSEFCLVDTVMMTLLERLDFSGLKLVYAEFSLARMAMSNSAATKGDSDAVGSSDANSGNDVFKPKYCTTFQNSIRSSDERLLVLCREELKFISIVGARKRIAALEEDGEWLEALAVALDHYESTISSQEDRRRDPGGSKDLSRHPEFAMTALKSEDEEWISRLLIRYLHLAVENAPESSTADHIHQHSLDTSQTKIDLAQSHFQMLAGVCVEFCVVTRRLDLLFGPIFRRFRFVGYTSVFLDVLEPYVLNDKLNYIAPEAMTYFVEHCKATNGIATVERCLLHMDVRIMDFDSILTLLRKNQMYSALFYVFNQGLDDFITPLEVLLENVFDAADEGCASLSRRRDGLPQNDFERLGYKTILYLRTCFQGKTFPKETPLQPDERLATLRAELLRFLLNEKFSPCPIIKKGRGKDLQIIGGHRTLKYPYAHILLMVDARAVLDAISLALDAPGVVFAQSDSNFESVGGWEVEVGMDTASESGMRIVADSSVDSRENNNNGRGANANNNSGNNYDDASRCPDMQRIIGMLTSIILPEESNDQVAPAVYKSKTAVNAFLDFMARYMMRRVVRVSKFVTYMILTRMAELYVAANHDTNARQMTQRQIIDLLTALPRNSYEPDEILKLMDRSGIHRAALLLHQEGASWDDNNVSSHNDPDARSRHFSSAIDCYLEDSDPTFRLEVFDYVKKECSGFAAEDHTRTSSDGNDASGNNNANEPSSKISAVSTTTSSTLRSALAARLPDLVHLDALKTAELVAELFVEDLDKVVTLLDKAGDRGDSQFMFFQTIISGSLSEVNPVAGAVLKSNLAMEHHHMYLALMARLHPDMVYEYLSTHDNYRPEECLKLCQQHEIADASAYLLERMGNVSSALQLILQTLESRMMGLKRTIRGMGLEFFRHHNKRHTFVSIRGRNNGNNASDNSTTSSFSSNIPLLPPSAGFNGGSGKQEKEVEGVKRTLIVALDLCERNSGTFSSTTSLTKNRNASSSTGARHHHHQQQQHSGGGGSQLWFNVLDRLINAKGFLRLSKEQPEHAEVMADVLSELLRMTMQRMVSSVPLTDLVRKVTSDNSGSRLGELREMIEVLLSTYKFELNVFKGAVNTFHHDVLDMHYKNRCLRRAGAGVSSIMHIPLSVNNGNIVNGNVGVNDIHNIAARHYLEKSSRDSCFILKLGGPGGGDKNNYDCGGGFGNATRAVDYNGREHYESLQQMNRSNENGLANAISRLRSRRGTGKTEAKPPALSLTSTGPNFMTDTERQYNMMGAGEITSDYCDTILSERYVGILGEAEHRGRLMSFM